MSDNIRRDDNGTLVLRLAGEGDGITKTYCDHEKSVMFTPTDKVPERLRVGSFPSSVKEEFAEFAVLRIEFLDRKNLQNFIRKLQMMLPGVPE